MLHLRLRLEAWESCTSSALLLAGFMQLPSCCRCQRPFNPRLLPAVAVDMLTRRVLHLRQAGRVPLWCCCIAQARYPGGSHHGSHLATRLRSEADHQHLPAQDVHAGAQSTVEPQNMIPNVNLYAGDPEVSCTVLHYGDSGQATFLLEDMRNYKAEVPEPACYLQWPYI